MSYTFELYRAPPGSPPLLRWESNLAEPLGSVDEVQGRIAALLPDLRWTRHADGIVTGRTHGLPVEAIGITLQPMEPGTVFFISADASPGVLRRLMTEFAVNCCCAEESGEMRDPFSVGAICRTTDSSSPTCAPRLDSGAWPCLRYYAKRNKLNE